MFQSCANKRCMEILSIYKCFYSGIDHNENLALPTIAIRHSKHTFEQLDEYNQKINSQAWVSAFVLRIPHVSC